MSAIISQLRWPGINVHGRNCELIMELVQPESKWVYDEDREFEPFFMDMTKHREMRVELIGPGRAFSQTTAFHQTFLDFEDAVKLMWSENALAVLNKGREYWKDRK